MESATIKRTLTAGALRDQRVSANFRSGDTTIFADAEDLPRLIQQLSTAFDALPEHPYVRAAWLIQAVGAIHPFIDGNGGTIRFLASSALVRASLPPLVLTNQQRNTTYADAFVDADNDPTALLGFIYDVVQQELGTVLLEDAIAAEWTEHWSARADAWIAIAERGWQSAAGIHAERSDTVGTRARLERRGYHVPNPTARLCRWASTAPVPLQFEIAISPVRAGDSTWMIASVVASIGDDGALGPLLWNEPIATTFVAAPGDAEAVADSRFARWLDKRIDQCVRGLGSWM